MEGILICPFIPVIQGMCPALNHWRQLLAPEFQSRAKSVSVDPACRVAAQDDMALSRNDEENLFRIAMSTEDALRKRFAEKQFQGSGAGSSDPQDGDGRAPIPVTSDDTGEVQFRGKESLIHLISTVMNWKRNSVEMNWKENSVKVNWREGDALGSGVDVEEDTQAAGR
jgi:hypothetical protein